MSGLWGVVVIVVAVTDVETGDVDTVHLNDTPSAGNYVVTCGPGCYVAHEQCYANGTTVLTIKAGSDGC